MNVASERGLWQSEWEKVRVRVYTNGNSRLTYKDLISKCSYHSESGGLLLNLNGKLNKIRPIEEITDVPIEKLFQKGILSKSTFEAAKSGYLTESELDNHLRRRIIGCDPIGAIYAEGRFVSLWDATKQGLVSNSVGMELMEAHVASSPAHGVFDVDSRKTISIDKAIQSGFIEPSTGDKLRKFSKSEIQNKKLSSRSLKILEVQLACGGILDPATKLYFQSDAAIKSGLIDENILAQVHNLKAFHDIEQECRSTYLDLCLKSKRDETGQILALPIKNTKRSRRPSGVPSGATKEKLRKRKIIVEDPETKEEMNVKTAFQRGLLTKEDAIELLYQEGKSEEQIRQIIENRKNGTDERRTSSQSAQTIEGNTDEARSDIFSGSSSASLCFSTTMSSQGSRTATPSLGAVSAAELEERLRLLATDGAKNPIGAIRDETTKEIISISEAEKRRLIDSLTEQRLLEAQAATGGIIDPKTNTRVSPQEAVSRKLVNSRLLSSLSEAAKAYNGFYDSRSRANTLSLAESLRLGRGSYEMMTRLLEMQIVLGGIIDTQTKKPISLQEAIERKWIDEKKAERISDFSKHSRQLVDPLNNLNSTYAAMLDNTQLINGITVLPAYPRQQRSLKLASGLNIKASSLASSRASSRGGSPPPELRITRHMGQF